MELFSLLAKLTLDASEFEKELDKAEEQADDLEIDDPKLGLDNSEFKDAIEDSNESADSFGQNVRSMFEGLKGALVATGLTAAIAALGNLLKECVNKAAEMGDAIDKGSKNLGINTKTYQQWNHALQQSGGSINDVARGMKSFREIGVGFTTITQEEAFALKELGISLVDAETGSKKTREQLQKELSAHLMNAETAKKHAEAVEALGNLSTKNANLTEDQARAFDELGVSLTDEAGKAKTAEQVMEDTILALGRMVDQGKEADQVGNIIETLFGRNAGSIKALIADGEEGVKNLLNEAEELGLIMSDEEITNAVAYGDAVKNLHEEIDAIKTAFVRDLMPKLTEAVKNITTILTTFNGRKKEKGILDIFDDIDKKSLLATKKLAETSGTAQSLIEKLSSMGDYWTLDENGQKTWNALAQEFIDAYPQFAQYIDFENKKINGNTSVIKENIRQWELREKQRILDENLAAKREALAQQYAKALDKEIEAELKQAEADGKKNASIAEMNAMLEKNQDLRAAFESKFGEGTKAGENNITDILDWYLNDDDHYRIMGDDTIQEYEKLVKEADKLNIQAKNMYTEADQAQASLEAYQAKLAEKMGMTETSVNNVTSAVRELKNELSTLGMGGYNILGGGGRLFHQAKGNWDVPYDSYPSLLHRGEMVLTASEARRYREGNSGIDLSGLEDRIAGAIRKGMEGAQVNSYLNGRNVTDEVARQMANDLAARRFG